MSALWTRAEVAAATGGRPEGHWQAAAGLSIDSRSLAPGEMFLALKAARDGHDFVADALARGAAVAIVSHRPPGLEPDAPLLVVKDVSAALWALARAGRARARARVVAITGSVGKTSSKEMLRAALAPQGLVHAAEASLNNHLGVPLTLARLPPEADFAVIEIGMSNPGEIAPLARLARPDVVLITTIAAAHLEALGSLEAIAQEKASICQGLAGGGVAVLPAGLAQTPILRAAAQAAGARVVMFDPTPAGAGAADWRLSDLQCDPEATRAQALTPAGALAFGLGAPGAHFAANALGVLATAVALGADAAAAVAGLRGWAPPDGRGNRTRVVLHPGPPEQAFDLIDDAFNANPASMGAAIAVLAAARGPLGDGGRRVAILGDMLELGPDEAALHAGLARLPGFGALAQVHCVGPRMRALWQGLPQPQRGLWADSAAALAARARDLVAPGDLVLVKGSKGSKVSAVALALAALGGPPRAAGAGDDGVLA